MLQGQIIGLLRKCDPMLCPIAEAAHDDARQSVVQFETDQMARISDGLDNGAAPLMRYDFVP